MWGSPRPRVTILDLMEFKGEEWFTSLFDGFAETDIPQQAVVDSILDRCAYCDILQIYTATFEFSVRNWAVRNADRYNRLWRALHLDYDLLHNYERWTIYQDKRELSENNDGTFSENNSENVNGTSTNTRNDNATTSTNSETKRSPYSNDNYYPYEQSSGSGSEDRSITDSGKDTQTTSGNRSNTSNDARKLSDDFVHNEFTQGDSGVNTPQDSLEQEWRLRQAHNVLDLIAREFDDNFCLGVY